jgi:putative acetyltransferase
MLGIAIRPESASDVTAIEAVVALSDGSPGWFGLGPISVLPEHQARGIGSRLMQEALQSLRNRGASGCVLVGDPGYYRRFGFQPEASLTCPGVPAEYLLALAFGMAVPPAEVTFHEALAARS